MAKKLDLKFGEEVDITGFGGKEKGCLVQMGGFWIGDFHTRNFAPRLTLGAMNFSKVHASSEKADAPRVDGFLGHDILAILSANIDYSTKTLYLQPPLKRHWPEIEGKWPAIEVQEDGRNR